MSKELLQMTLQQPILTRQEPTTLGEDGPDSQPTLPTFSLGLAQRSRRSVGLMGERAAAALLEQSNYQVSFTRIGEKRGDLRAINAVTGQVHLVEVKTARRCKDGKWRFTLFLANKIDHRHADVVILLAALESGRLVPFIIPIAILKDQRQAVITSHPDKYAGKLAEYRAKGIIQL